MDETKDFLMEEKKHVPAGFKQGTEEKKRICMVCGKPSPTTICSQCEAKIRGEALEHKHEVEKAGRTDTGRR
mgnify:CR=1 FL=1